MWNRGIECLPRKARERPQLILRGVKLFPSQIEHAFLELERLTPPFLMLVGRRELESASTTGGSE